MKLIEESYMKDVHLTISDSEGQLRELFETIKDYTQMGHSFTVVVDPGDEDYEKSFYIDGDGSDKINDIDIREVDEDDTED